MGLIQEFQKADGERQREVKQLQDEVANMLKDFAEGDTERKSAVTEYMHTEVGKIRSGVATMIKDLAKGSAERASEVAAIRSEVATQLKELGQEDNERQAEVTAIHEMVWSKTPAKKVAAPAVKELPRKVPPDKQIVETVPAGELGDKVSAYLANHPDGTRLTELEEEFGVARIQTARVIRELMDDGKVAKRDLLYFTT